MKNFEKKETEMPPKMALPSDKIIKIITSIKKLGKTIVAIRGDGFSGNLLGTISLGEDGRDCVLRIDECKCHIHVDWKRISDVLVDEEDVGYGPEGVIRLIDFKNKPIVHLFYSHYSKEYLKNALSL